MSPEMLMQPFNTMSPMANNSYYNPLEVMSGTPPMDEESLYFLGGYHHHPHFFEGNENFRATFYNPFEIKHRRRTSRAQLKVLEKSFSENPKPNATVRRILAQQLDMTPRGVQIWFQNRRAKAKLQRRKSGEKEELIEDQQEQQLHQDKQNNSPVLFTQFFNNLKNWDHNNNQHARSIATQAAASCMFSNFESTTDSIKMEDFFKSSIHPLAPVIESSDNVNCTLGSDMIQEEWRRKSCHALGSKEAQPQQQLDSQNYYLSWPTMMPPSNDLQNNYNRRMTADSVLIESNPYQLSPPYPMVKSSYSECNTPRWSSSVTPPTTSIDFYSNFNYSPISQQLTPLLSTGSPVSSIDGNCYDPCFDLSMSANAPTSS
ncbi:Homeobox protein HD-10 [Choanephora cucurbitarum]|uniref:Homeobox protein HD-10 n=1 Tax=Choanephora cucurbitarum TaxID=101091 RepID=A0A1C7N1Q8_9FUNG|nr:Homeobox protein HD-10 [Choanephora cucurbitarum]